MTEHILTVSRPIPCLHSSPQAHYKMLVRRNNLCQARNRDTIRKINNIYPEYLLFAVCTAIDIWYFLTHEWKSLIYNFEGMWPCKMLMIVTPTDYVRLQYLSTLSIFSMVILHTWWLDTWWLRLINNNFLTTIRHGNKKNDSLQVHHWGFFLCECKMIRKWPCQ